MASQKESTRFIGRRKEIQQFKEWLQDANAPWILYLHDAAEEKEKKGGIGKTWLLRHCAEIVAQEYPDTAVLMVDFFNVEDRDRLFLAEKVVKELHRFCPEWNASAFVNVIDQYYSKKTETTLSKRVTDIAEDETTFTDIAAALVEDIQHLEPILVEQHKHLLLAFDTFEIIEDNPVIAVLRSSQTFPDNYSSSHIKVVMAGRNRLSWDHANWRGRQHEIQSLSLLPFSKQEMLAYIDAEAMYNEPPREEQQIAALYKRTEGRPIMIGLVVDVLNNHIQGFDELIAIGEKDFEENLIPQIYKLENPMNWVILFMAHAYHHFNLALLEHILDQVPQPEPIRPVNREEMAEALPQLSFVRRSSTGDSFVLHDEMRRLVVKYCWEELDPDRRYRKAVSQRVMEYYMEELTRAQNESWQQLCDLVILHHRLFIDLSDGLQYFKSRFLAARILRRRGFARLLFQEAQNVGSSMSLVQRNDLQLAGAQLLRLEDALDDALNALDQIKKESDPQWYETNYYEVLNEEGLCYQKKNLWDDAERCFNECLAVETERNNQARCAPLLNRLGYIARRRGQFATAITYYQQSADLFKHLGKMLNYADVLNNMGYAYRYQGKIEEALLRCKISWRLRWNLFQKGEVDEVIVGWSLSTLGIIYLSAGNISEAESRFNAAYDIYSRNNAKADIAATYHRFGQIQFERKNWDDALTWFIKAEQAAVEANIESYIMSLSWQGRVYMQQQRWTEAQVLFEQAMQRAQQVTDNYQAVESLIYLAECLAVQSQEIRSQQFLLEAEQNARERSYYDLLGRIEHRRGETQYHLDNFQQAFQHFVAYCHYMTLYNYGEYTSAVQRVIDALIGVTSIIGQNAELIVNDMARYWEHHQLNKEYPELIAACEEVKELL
ncbi:MAG: tetratricopeptide repeat protein [Chloroflexi bacterium]|nr:MAG: tetratricopeptide repeat protein [Chloroflexota bacterium]